MGATAAMIGIVDCGMGNLQSVVRAFQRTGATVVVTSSHEEIARAERIVLPGVGSFDQGMGSLRDSGLIRTLTRRVMEDRVPVLGVCLGFQMLTECSEEGTIPGLGWIPGHTRRFLPEDGSFKVPHLGWNEVSRRKESPLFAGIDPGRCFYFAHSYYVTCTDPDMVVGTTTYGSAFASVVQHANIFGTQFHPEKSHLDGLKLIENFVRYS